MNEVQTALKVSAPEARPIRILAVDDDAANLQALDAILAQPDREIVHARSAADALRYLLDEDFALILLDVVMPEMDGLELATLIRTRDRTRTTPIIFLTAAGGTEAAARGYELGAIDYITKPIDSNILRYKVATVIELLRKSAEVTAQARELAQQRALLHGILQGATSHGIAALDAEGSIVLWNEGARRLFGQTTEQVRNRPLSILFEEGQAHIARELVEQVASGRPVEIETTLRHADGRTFEANLTLTERLREDGRYEGCVVVVRDLTDARVAEQARADLMLERGARYEAEAAERRMQQLMDVLPEPTVVFGPSGNLLVLNGAARSLLPGLHRDEDLRIVTAFDPVALGPDEANDAVLTEHPVGRVLNYGETVLGEEMVLVSGGGGVPVLVNAAPLRTPVGEIVGGILALTDISGLKAMAAEKDTLLAALSHDMKTPLTVVVGNAQLLQRALRRPEPDMARVLDLAVHIDTTATRMAMMVDEMLEATNARIRLSPLHHAPFDLRLLATGIVAGLESVSHAHTLVLDVRTDHTQGQWNQRHVERILFNLIENAIKFSAGGEVRITLDDASDAIGRWLRLSVADQGIGIPADELERIFERFERGSNATDIPGSGIGLASVQRMVKENRGRVSVESEVGVGTRVTVELPA